MQASIAALASAGRTTTKKRTGTLVFAHSRWDAVLVSVGVIEVALVAVFAVVGRHAGLGWAAGAAAYVGGLALLTFVNATNVQCVAHNHIHNPFFRAGWANALFSMINSIAIGMPQTLYRVHHLNHHKYGNDKPNPETGETKDLSSFYRHAKPGAQESIWSYALLSPIRAEVGPLLADVKRMGLGRQVIAETVTLAAFVGVLFVIDWRGALFFYLPAWYFGQVAAYAENYLEHNHATPGNRKTDSVSAYGAVYNFIWFNNGYHQEHHYRANIHWLDLPSLRKEMLPETERHVVRGAHWTNF